MLSDVVMTFEPKTTLVVGRNNSGKTSLSEIFRRFLLPGPPPKFNIEDFSLSVHEKFIEAFKLFRSDPKGNDLRSVLPFIELIITLEYEKDLTQYGALAEFIIDLDLESTTAIARVRYQLQDGRIGFLHFMKTFRTLKTKKVEEIFFD